MVSRKVSINHSRRWKCDMCDNKGQHECTLCSGTGLGRMLWDIVFGEKRYITITCEACKGRKIVKCQDCNRKWFKGCPHQARILGLLSRGRTAYVIRKDIEPIRLIPRGRNIEISYLTDGKWSRGKQSNRTDFASVKGYLDMMERLVVKVHTNSNIVVVRKGPSPGPFAVMVGPRKRMA